MIRAKVGELRNHLSKYLKKVRQGAEVIITDRDTPVGRLVPLRTGDEAERFEMIPPPRGFEGFARFKGPDIECPIDPVQLLLEDRRKR